MGAFGVHPQPWKKQLETKIACKSEPLSFMSISSSLPPLNTQVGQEEENSALAQLRRRFTVPMT
eukprot:765838-Hanusia_phi.AAC.2